MNEGFLLWYRAPWSRREAAVVLRRLAALGLAARNPLTGAITVIADEPGAWGEQRSVSEPELLDGLDGLEAGSPGVAFQLWLDAASDVFTAVRATGNGIVVEFGLEGLGERQEQVVRALVRIVATFRSGCQGFVLDRAGRTWDEDWDGVVEGACPRLGDWPDILGIGRELAEHLLGPPAPSRFPDGALTVFSRG
ncbi:hypothetical protein ACGFZP_34820 [Kitasatospora sp. NPDC048239]|uniref:hypothetical protein n=1 Tax=Kitasatospora sp. NPDC048239 TaxID=3364046 RepID=UPI003716507C